MHYKKMSESLYRFRIPLFLLSMLLLVVSAIGLKNTVLVTDYKEFFNQDDPYLNAYLDLQDNYDGADHITFLIRSEDGSLFTKDTLKTLKVFTEKAWELPFTTRVDSITNYQHSYAEGDSLIVEDLVDEIEQFDAAKIARVSAIATTDKTLVNRLISPSGDSTAIHVSMIIPDPLIDSTNEMMSKARELVSRIKAEAPHLTIYLSGVSAVNHAFGEIAEQDGATMLPLMFLIILVICGLLLRSLASVALVLFIIIASILTSLGLAGWMGIPLNNINIIAPNIILTLAVTDSVHLLTSFFKDSRTGMDKVEALKRSLEMNIRPIFLTSLTTILGFLSLNFNESPPFRSLGNITAMGVAAAFIYSLLALPFLMALLSPAKKVKAKEAINFDGYLTLLFRNRNIVLWVVLASSILLASFSTLNKLNDDNIDYFDQSTEIWQAANFSDKNIGGPLLLEYGLDSGQQSGIYDPAYLAKVDAFSQWLGMQPDVVHVNSFTDVLKRINRNMQGDQDGNYALPDSRELAAQYTLLYELSLPYGLGLTNQVTLNKEATRLSVIMHKVKADRMIELNEQSLQWLQNNAPEISTEGASVNLMFAHLGHENLNSMIKGSIIIVMVIALTLVITLGSLRFGLISMVPNLLPPLVMFGIWGLLIGEINFGAAAVFSIAIGIIVDDTVHMLSKYEFARNQHKLSAEDAIRYVFKHTGFALIITTTAIALGFFALSFSLLDLNKSMGLMVSSTVVIALILDFVLLPVLLLWLDKDKTTSAAVKI
jgi:predicted RND superfamily exporter protein